MKDCHSDTCLLYSGCALGGSVCIGQKKMFQHICGEEGAGTSKLVLNTFVSRKTIKIDLTVWISFIF